MNLKMERCLQICVSVPLTQNTLIYDARISWNNIFSVSSHRIYMKKEALNHATFRETL